MGALRSHGVTTAAEVELPEPSFGTANPTTAVRFDVAGTSVVETLTVNDTVPRDLRTGQEVEVVFLPEDPSSVLLTSQVNLGHLVWDYAIAALGGVVSLVEVILISTRRRGRLQ